MTPAVSINLHLPEEVAGWQADEELDRLLRVAAWAGAESDSDVFVSFTSTLIGFLFAEDPVSVWFQEYSGRHSVNTSRILGYRRTSAMSRSEVLRRSQVELPSGKPMWSVSAKGMLRRAAKIAERIAPEPKLLGTRHLLAAYAFETPQAHTKQMEEWGLEKPHPASQKGPWWGSELVEFLARAYPQEGQWRRAFTGHVLTQEESIDRTRSVGGAAVETSPAASGDGQPKEAVTEPPAEPQQEAAPEAPEEKVAEHPLSRYRFTSEGAMLLGGAVSIAWQAGQARGVGEGRSSRLSSTMLCLAALEAGKLPIDGDFAELRSYAEHIPGVSGPVLVATWQRYGGAPEAKSFSRTPPGLPELSPNALAILDAAEQAALATTRSREIAPRHWLAALLIGDANHSGSMRLLRDLGVDPVEDRQGLLRDVTQNRLSDELAAWRTILLGAAPTLLASFSPDRSEGKDRLDVERYAEALATLMASENLEPPLSIGVFGDWGSGKSFFMHLLRVRIKVLTQQDARGADGRRLFCRNVVSVEFNAWHYAETNLWASLIQTILQTIFDRHRGADEAARLDRLMQELGVATEQQKAAEERYTAAATERATAAKKLEEAEQESREKARELEKVRAPDVLAAVKEEAFAFAGSQDAEELASAMGMAETYLGISGFAGQAKEKIGEVEAVVKDARLEAARARSAWSWLLHAPVAGVLVPAAVVVIAGGWLAWEFRDSVAAAWTSTSAVLALGGIAIGWARKHLQRIHKGLDYFDSLRARVDRQVAGRLAANSAQVEQRKRELEEAQKQVEQAEKELAEADRKLAEARRAVEESRPARQLARLIEQRIQGGDYEKQLGIVAMIRGDLEKLSRFLLASRKEGDNGKAAAQDGFEIDRVVLYIDDLDRCPTKRVVEVLEATHLLLAFPLFVVVVGVDVRWAARSLYQSYPLHLSEEGVSNGSPEAVGSTGGLVPASGRKAADRATALDYLEKIFQIPFWLPQMTEDASKNLIASLVPPLAAPAKAASPTDAAVEPDGHFEESRESSAAQEARQDAGPEPLLTDGSTQDPAAGEREAAAGEAPAPATGGEVAEDAHPATPPPPGIQPENLAIEQLERQYMMMLAPSVGKSPRRLKRFVNTYRILKAACTAPERRRFVLKEGAGGEYRAAMVLLAITTGAPRLALPLFADLLGRNDAETLDAFARSFEERHRSEDPEETAHVRAALAAFRTAQSEEATIRLLRQWAPQVARFSFRSWRM